MNDILDRVRAADPAAHMTRRSPDENRVRAGVADVIARVTPEGSAAVAAHSRRRTEHHDARVAGKPDLAEQATPRSRWGTYALGAVAAAAAVGLVVTPMMNHTDSPDRAPATTAVPASRAAHPAEGIDDITVVDSPARRSQFWEVTTLERVNARTNGGPFTYPLQRHIDYVSADGSGRPVSDTVTLERDRGVPDTSPVAQRTWTWRYDLAPNQMRGGWGRPNPAFLSALPRNPKALRARLYAASAGQGLTPDGNAMQFARDLLRSNIVPADLRGVLFTVMATIPGTKVHGGARTTDGRTGISIARLEPRQGATQEIIVDPSTGFVIGERSVVVTQMAGWPPAGSVADDSSITRRLVDAVPPRLLAQARCEVDQYPGRTEPSRC